MWRRQTTLDSTEKRIRCNSVLLTIGRIRSQIVQQEVKKAVVAARRVGEPGEASGVYGSYPTQLTLQRGQ
jgi:hypothetical protein